MSPVHYDLDETHTTVGFSVRHMMVTRQQGLFRAVRGTLELDREDPTRSHVEAVIDVASIDTRVPQRDEHLRSADFFDVARHPEMRFVSRRVEAQADGRLRVIGDLTLRGVTRQVVLDADPLTAESRDPFGMIKVGTSATTLIRRKEFGLVWNTVLETGGVAVGDDVTVSLDLQFQRKP